MYQISFLKTPIVPISFGDEVGEEDLRQSAKRVTSGLIGLERKEMVWEISV